MNAPDHIAPLQPIFDLGEQERINTLTRFNLEAFQNLTKADLVLAQTIAGHGSKWGVWETPKIISPSKLKENQRVIIFAKRLRDILANEPLPETSPDLLNALVEEGVLILTRLALLLRLAPTAGNQVNKNRRLKPSTLTRILSSYLPQILARAILRKATRPDARGLFGCLTEDDVHEFSQVRQQRVELERLGMLEARGLWTDLPPHPDITQTTDPSGPKPKPVPQETAGEWQPIADEYLAEFGPRNLWLIRDLGPNLLPLLEDLATHLKNLNWSDMTVSKLKHPDSGIIGKFITIHLREHPWKDQLGRPLQPTFPLKTASKSEKDKFEWPPRNYAQLTVLSATLQSAHLFLTLLATAGRVGEVETLPRTCVTTERDGKDYVRGWTYKLSGNLFGDARQWPAPLVLVQALGQQVRLANVWSRMPSRLVDAHSTTSPAHDALWLSLGSSRTNAAEPLFNISGALQTLAERIGMDPKPGGINLHPHRCRKTIARLAGVALFNSPLVLKRLFGHKSIEMTLHYILADKDIRTQAETVLRELRILHCAEVLGEVREALATDVPLPGNNGVAASRMVDAVKEHEARLKKSGRVWSDGSAYDLAYVLTSSGQGWRFVQKNIVCAKVPGEGGLCRKKNKGEPNTANCKPACDNRIVLALERRNVSDVVESYIDVASQARDEEQHMVFYELMNRLIEEIDAFPDIKSHYLKDTRIQSLLTSYKELNP